MFNELLDKWEESVAMHSTSRRMLMGKAFDSVMQQSKEDLIKALLIKLQGGNDWMGYQQLLRELTCADIWEGTQIDAMRTYDVEASAQAWVEWGKKNGYLNA